MHINVDSDTLITCFVLFFILLFVFLIATLIMSNIAKSSDNGKPLITCRVKILERLSINGSIAWYIIEDEKGNRLRLRSLKANEIIITAGDTGIMEYRGKTIESFKRD